MNNVKIEDLKIGDTVVFRTDLVLGEYYGGIKLLDPMCNDIINSKYLMTIIDLKNDGDIIFDKSYFGYSIDMIDSIVESKNNSLGNISEYMSKNNLTENQVIEILNWYLDKWDVKTKIK